VTRTDKAPGITCSVVVARVGPTPQGVLALDFGTRKAQVWARPDPRYGPWRKIRSISMPDDAVQPRRPDVRQRPSMHASCSRGASLCRQAATSTRLSTASASLTRRSSPLYAILPRFLQLGQRRAGPASSANDELARPSQAADEEECLSPPAVVTDAQEALFWTSAASRVWVAAVWSQSMYSGISPRLRGKPVW